MGVKSDFAEPCDKCAEYQHTIEMIQSLLEEYKQKMIGAGELVNGIEELWSV
mgnify:CR=1 FL=1